MALMFPPPHVARRPEWKRARVELLAFCALFLLYVVWLVLGWIPDGSEGNEILVFPFLNALVIFAAWRAAGRCRNLPPLRAFWLLIAIAWSAEFVGDVIQAAYVVGPSSPPFPSQADPFYIVFYPLLLLALLRVPTVRGTRSQRLRMLLDSATIVVGGGAAIWYFLLGPAVTEGGQSLLSAAVSIAYPLGDLAVLTAIAAVLMRRSPPALRIPLNLIAAGLLILIAADMIYGAGLLHAMQSAGSAVGILYFLVAAPFLLAATFQAEMPAADSEAGAEPAGSAEDGAVEGSAELGSHAIWLALVGMAMGFGILFAVQLQNPFFPDLSLLLFAIALAALAAARQQVVQRELRRTAAQLRRSERLKDEFVSVVGHELRTPLTSIRGSLGLLEGGVMGELPEEAKAMASTAIDNTDRLVRLVNDILDIERIDSGRAEIELAPVSAAALVEQSVQVVGEVAGEAGVELRSEVEDTVVSCDADTVVQTLTNLLGNAIKFSEAGAAITIAVAPKDGQAVFAVRDTGRGIPADQLESIFERFSQVDASDAREKGGTGLGLAIARDIVEGHGGRIWAESEEGKGTTFSFTLPLAAGAGKSDRAPEVDPVPGKESDGAPPVTGR